LKSYGVEVCVHDPRAEAEAAMHEYGVRLMSWSELPRADAMVAAVAHSEFRALSAEDLCRKVIKGGCFVDVKALFDDVALRASGLRIWRL
jgi:UDP-N-acetyl-D-galactosamine dehydrogenase